ncbi:hypothetical protein KAFR_0H03680 [Kazachstania africana CBS 2517]|uniref:U3 small nucleolar ribonucleoprotein protein MPP10 n=1 Tax=Kazachstania africana (strain ATCC 22294 / BCRC 22015 / CBS 2517 / CECT 1963 / NBRC 1671 / NRRL Y-8276) TaxID=1071382 RepID=H2AYK1_KAZAF|nr:hypothetical protein KAFR_0H03680 [Kazachstania africana CBS 2517]CCF59778.1 hypothetical protein KAFR_0H03680 [Kazachstania africana CBS 2517]
MSDLIDIVKNTPVDVISNDSAKPLNLVKSYIDSVIEINKTLESSVKTDIDEVTVDGLDANQVWWQAKIVIDKIGADLMERIQELKAVVDNDDNELESSDDMKNDDIEEQLENSEEEQEDGFVSAQESAEENEVNEAEISEQDESDFEIEEGRDDYAEESEEDEGEDEAVEDDEGDENVEAPSTSKNDPYKINDEFFNLEEFNKQTLAQEDGNLDDIDNEDDEEIDYFADLPSDEDEEADYYEDFFDKPRSQKPAKKPVEDDDDEVEEEEENGDEDFGSAMSSLKLDLFDENDEEDAEEADGDKLSTFEKQQLEIQKQIAELEKEAIAEKKWALKGEVKAKDRPDNALLTEDIEFDRTSKPVPVITNEVTESLEDMIRKRIKEYTFDDLQRRTIHDFNMKAHKPRFELSDVKSSKSLAQLYEDDYQGVTEETEISEELQKSHDEVSKLFNDICYKLDALSSAHFIPKPAEKSLEVRVETAAITMEDAQPLSMSTASTLAPQEVYRSGKADNDKEIKLNNGTVMSREELTREDKNRLRRSIKRKRAKHMISQAQRQPKKKSKKDDVIDTLSRAKNVTVVNKSGEKHDTRGNVRKNNNAGSSVDKVRL